MPARRLTRTSLTALGTAAALCVTAPAALATFPGDNGRLAVGSSDPGRNYISSIGPNGSDGRHIDYGAGATWSPSGAALAFERITRFDCGLQADGSEIATDRSEVFIGDAAGQNAKSLGIADSSGAQFSPDGQRVEFSRLSSFDATTCERGPSERWVADADGSNARAAGGPADGWPHLTATTRDGAPGIFVVSADGADYRRLTTGEDSSPSWSPDRRKVVFERYIEADGSNVEVFTVDADGTAETRLTDTGAGTGTDGYARREIDPVWAPDGKSIAYLVHDYYTADVYMTDPSGRRHVKAFTASCRVFTECGDAWSLEDWQPLPAGSSLIPNPSFEQSTSGWGSYAGTLTRVAQSGAPEGSYVAKATRASGATKFSISDGQGGYKETIPFTSAGETYVGSVRVKAASSSSVGKPVTVYLREKSPSGATVRESKVASTLSSSWKRIAVSAKVSGTGNSLGLRVEQTSAVSGNAFYGDAFSLTKARTQVGSAAAGTLLTTMGGDSKRVSRVAVDTGFDAVRLRAYLDGKGGTAGSQSVRGVIYADSTGAPGARVGSTSSVSIAAGRAAGWVDFELSTPVGLRAGSYWVGLQSSTPSAVARWAGTSKAGALRFNTDAYSDGAASSFGTPRTDDKEMSLQVVGG